MLSSGEQVIFIGSTALNAALFDLDGTLVQSRIDFALMRTEMLRISSEAGIAPSVLDGREILEMVEAAAECAPSDKRKMLREAMWLRLEEIERAGCLEAQPVAGAPEMMRRLRDANVKIGIVTRNCRSVSAPLLAQLDLPYDVLLTRDDVARCKPDPTHLRNALSALNVEACHALMTGDHWLDVQAGKECGCAATLGILGERPSSWFDRCRPDFSARDLSEARSFFHD